MIGRRTVLQLAAFPLLARIARAGGAGKPEIWLGDDVPPGPNTISALRLGGKPSSAKLDRRVTAKSLDLLATNNDNTRFRLWAVFPKMPDRWMFLGLDGTWWRSESIGHDDTGSQTTWEIDRDTAKRFAAAFKLPMHERTRLDEGLRATWIIPPRAVTHDDAPITVTLHVENAGKTTVGFLKGGRQRGPRDNRFTFKVTRNGTPVPIKDAPDFGGVMGYQKLAPGEKAHVSADLRSWADLGAPGHYAIDVSYEGELAKDGKMPATAAEQANVWDVVLKGQGGILVQ